MNSKNETHEEYAGRWQASDPKTPLEEILFVVESTNDIVSKILDMMEEDMATTLRFISLMQKMVGEK